MKKLYCRLSAQLERLIHCETVSLKHGDQPSLNAENAEEQIKDMVKEYMPSGSGIDSGVKFDFDKSKPDKLVFHFGYYHMNENGMYVGWTYHSLIVTPSLASEFNLRVTGRNQNDIKPYLYEIFHEALRQELEA